MSDNPKKKKQDSKLVSNQDYELNYTSKKLNITKRELIKTKNKVGPSRKKITKSVKDRNTN
jgi:hypothetical protein